MHASGLTIKTQTNRTQAMINSSVFWFLFFFTLVFPPMYMPIDIRIPISLFWLLLLRKVVILHDGFQKWIVAIAIYSMLIIFSNGIIGEEVDIGVVAIRYFRVLLTATVIASAFRDVDSRLLDTILQTIAFLLAIHSAIIVLEIMFPVIKDYMFIYCGKSRIFYQYRANGFVNSYDFAGFFANIGVLLNALLAAEYKKNKNYIFFVLCIIAALFTSRLNMLFCAVTILFLRRIVKKQSAFLRIVIDIVFVFVLMGAIFMWAITTDSLASVRAFLFSRFDWMPSFYTMIRNTYSDDIISEQIAYQYYINGKSAFQIVGTGSDPNRDPGYVQMLYGIGIVGTLMCIVPHVIIAFRGYKKARNAQKGIYKIVFLTLSYVAVYELLLNFKILFLFSTGAFEILYIMFLASRTINEEV